MVLAEREVLAVGDLTDVVEVGVDAPPELQAAATSITAPRAAPTNHRDGRDDRGRLRSMSVPM